MGQLWRGLTGFLVAGIVYAFADKVPLPELDVEAAYRSAHISDRLSINALGLTPIFTALAYAEIARLIFLHTPTPGGSTLGRLATWSLALMITGLQGYGVVSGLSSANLISSPTPVVAIVGTLVGATAILIMITERLELSGFRNGFWTLWVVAYLLVLPSDIMNSVSATVTGMASIGEWLVILAYGSIGVCAASIVRAVWISSFVSDGPCGPQEDGFGILVWPPYLANLCGGYLIMVLAVVSPAAIDALMPHARVMVFAAMCALTPIFTYGYFRRAQKRANTAIPIAVFVLISAVQVLIVAVGGVIDAYRTLPMWVSGLSLLVLTIVILDVGGKLPGVRWIRSTGRTTGETGVNRPA